VRTPLTCRQEAICTECLFVYRVFYTKHLPSVFFVVPSTLSKLVCVRVSDKNTQYSWKHSAYLHILVVKRGVYLSYKMLLHEGSHKRFSHVIRFQKSIIATAMRWNASLCVCPFADASCSLIKSLHRTHLPFVSGFASDLSSLLLKLECSFPMHCRLVGR
jgi:hypothetical protein